jgi:hypothetical protein
LPPTVLHHRLACSIGLTSAIACAAPPPYSVRVVDAHGEPLPTTVRRGQVVVSGRPGQTYGIEVTNRTADAVGIVVSVDGLDTQSGRAEDFTPEGIDRRGGFELSPHRYWTHQGFAASDTSVSTFRFVGAADSLGARLGRVERLGTIEIGLFTLLPAKPGAHFHPGSVGNELARVGEVQGETRGQEPIYGELQTSVLATDFTITTTAGSRPLAHFLFAYEGPGATKLGTAGPPPRPAPEPTPPSAAPTTPPPSGPGEVEPTVPGTTPPKGAKPSKDKKPQDPAVPAPTAPKPGKGTVGKTASRTERQTPRQPNPPFVVSGAPIETQSLRQPSAATSSSSCS